MEDRSALFNQLKEFSQRKLKKVETKVVTGLGEQLVEKRGAKGLQVRKGGEDGGCTADSSIQESARKLDLQVGFILPGLLIGSQDVAHDKSSLENHGIEYILNLDADVENKFEDDYNYKNVPIQDKPDFSLDTVLDDCFDFIDEGRQRSNVLVHCSGTIGLSRSTSICVAYLMNKEKQAFGDAYNNVKEARSFVKPNEGFLRQLKDYELKLRGAQQVKDSGIDDPFALRKKQEIEQEKAMVAGAASVKNRMKMFGANLDASAFETNRSKSVSPMPASRQPDIRPASRWTASNSNASANTKSPGTQTKSKTPEPRSRTTSDWNSSSSSTARSKLSDEQQQSLPPPPPPPMPTTSPKASYNKEERTANGGKPSRSSYTSAPPPPPPPPPPSGSFMKEQLSTKQTPPLVSSSHASLTPTISKPATTSSSSARHSYRKTSIAESSDDDSSRQSKQVFGCRPPPQMKIRGGLSIERQDSVSSHGAKRQQAASGAKTQNKGSLQLPLKKQFTSDSDGESATSRGQENPRAPSPSAALRAAKQQASCMGTKTSANGDDQKPPASGGGQLNRSSTKKLLNLIKTKTRTDLTLPDGDENDEIEALLGALESESIENIDWDELGLDEDEVKDIIKRGATSESESESSDDSADDGDEEEEEEVETSTLHLVIRTK